MKSKWSRLWHERVFPVQDCLADCDQSSTTVLFNLCDDTH